METPPGRTYQFGPFRIHSGDRLLFRGDELVPLTPKAVDTLLVLIERRGHVVDKNELLRLVWPDAFVEEGGLARNISQLRKALGEDPDDARYIETIPKRGYRFVAEVTDTALAEGPAPAAGRIPRRALLAALALLVAAAAAAAYFWARQGSGEPLVRALAVLPLRNLSGDAAQQYFCEGITEALITHLAGLERLRVISPASVMRYQGLRQPLEEIARKLGVEAVVEGSVLHAGGRVRITARLMQVRTGRQLWAESYERETRDVLSLQGEVAAAIVRGVRMKLTPQERQHLDRAQPVNPQAYDAYLKGRFFANKRTEHGLRRAVEYFEEAIRIDPGYAPAHSGLADSWALLGSNGIDALPPRQAMPLAKSAAQRALAIDPSLGEAHASLAYVLLSYDWDLPAAETEFRRAIQLNPGYATAHHWHSHYYLAAGRLEQACSEMRRAASLDPLSLVINVGLGWCDYYSGRNDQAIEQYRKTLELDPGFALAHQILGMALTQNGSHHEAIAALEKAVSLAEGSPSTLANLGYAYAAAGRTADARAQLRRLEELSRRRYVPALYRALVYAGLGEPPRLLAWLRRACEERSDYLIYFHLEPASRTARSDPRVLRLMRELGPRANR